MLHFIVLFGVSYLIYVGAKKLFRDR